MFSRTIPALAAPRPCAEPCWPFSPIRHCRPTTPIRRFGAPSRSSARARYTKRRTHGLFHSGAWGGPKEKIPAELYAAFEGAPGAGRDDHTLDGPIEVRGAEIGDTVEIKIRSIDLWPPIAGMSFRGEHGTLREDMPYSRDKVLFFDPAKKAI